MKTTCLLVALANVVTASATVRVFVTASADGYGLENPANHMVPTASTVYANNVSVNGYDYEDYYYNPGPLRPGTYPPADSPSGTVDNPVLIDSGWAYIWLQFQSEPAGSKIEGLQITIAPSANVATTYYLCNNLQGPAGATRWDGTATPPGYPEWHNNPQTMVAITRYGLQNWTAALAWNLWSGGASRIALLGAVEAPLDGTTYTIDITNIYVTHPPTNPSVSGGVFKMGISVVPPGQDCWHTECGQTLYNFSETPLPCGFFEPGSEPFDGLVYLGGSSPDGIDTRMNRLDEMTFGPEYPTTAVTFLEVGELHLMGCAPIEVRYCNGTPAQLWEVEVTLSSAVPPPPPGVMTVTRTHPNGGLFSSQFLVQPVFTFRKVADPNEIRILDTGAEGIPPVLLDGVSDAPWVHTATINVGAVCGVNFVPGVQEGGVPGRSCASTAQCCRDVGHGSGRGHLHVTGHICVPCPCGACCLPDGTCMELSGADLAELEALCDESLGTFIGIGSSCTTADGDSIPDSFETNDCCPAGNPCPGSSLCSTPTDPTLADTDGDGLNDDVDPAPCDRCDPPSAPNRPPVCDVYGSDCNDNGVCDLCDIRAGTSFDCNKNGVPDECEPDCNNNGVPDDYDITCGTSQDCQPDGIPDECQLGGGLNLSIDDGTSENIWGLTAGGEPCWMDHLVTATPGNVKAIGACFGSPAYPGYSGVSPGTSLRVYVWSDPNQDGNPVDAVFLGEATGTVEVGSIDTDVVQAVEFSPVIPVSGSFFIGASVNHPAGGYPAPADDDGQSQVDQAFLTFNSVPFDPTNIAANLYPMSALGYPTTVFIVRTVGGGGGDCNGNGIPDECDIASGYSQDHNQDGIPDECEVCPGDLNCDGIVDFGDINPFVLYLSNFAQWQLSYPGCPPENGDINGDGSYPSFGDINPFVALIVQSPIVCPP
jgi:hypothetical protein